ncbi:MAG: hypothetical protein ABSB22_07905 [Thermodesulfobacteriota bacterium]
MQPAVLRLIVVAVIGLIAGRGVGRGALYQDRFHVITAGSIDLLALKLSKRKKARSTTRDLKEDTIWSFCTLIRTSVPNAGRVPTFAPPR